MLRRDFLAGASATPLANLYCANDHKIATPAEKDALCLLRAKQLGDAMKDFHGGDWGVRLDHDSKVVVVFAKHVSQP